MKKNQSLTFDIFNSFKNKKPTETPQIIGIERNSVVSLPDLTEGKIWIGNASNKAAEQSLSNDVTIDKDGVATLKTITYGTTTSYNKFNVDTKGRITDKQLIAYLTGNESITLSGDISGSGTTAITATLATVNSNVGTFTKVTVNAKGLTTAASNATTADINSSTNRRYVTDAQLAVVENTSGINSGDETGASIKTKLGAASTIDDGYLTTTDWNTFDGKQDALTISTGLAGTTTITATLSTGTAGGQSVIGGTAASEDLTLSSTAHITKGSIIFGTSAYDENNNRLGIGTTSPTESIETTGAILTGNPAGGIAKPFKIGSIANVSPTSPNRTVEIDINGTIIYLTGKTTND